MRHLITGSGTYWFKTLCDTVVSLKEYQEHLADADTCAECVR